MKKHLTISFSIILAVVFAFSVNLKAQTSTDDNTNSLDNTLSHLSQDAANAYVAPVISAFGSNLNAGWINGTPAAAKMEFNLNFKIVAMGSFFSDESKTFSSTGIFQFNRDQALQLTSGISNTNARNAIADQITQREFTVNIAGPTLVGNKESEVKVLFPGETFSYNGQSYTVPSDSILTGAKGFLGDIPALPTGAFQIGVGTVYGTNLTFRFLPSLDLGDMGKFSFWGIGVMHNPAMWIDQPLPLDVAVGFFYQDMKIGNVFETSATQFAAYASKTFGGWASVTPYLGLSVEGSTTTVGYDFSYTDPAGNPASKNVKFEIKGQNSVGLTIGANFKLSVLNLNLDYKLASTKTATAGLSFAF